MADTKKCRHCQSEIDAKASVCPHCRKRVKGGGCMRLLLISSVGVTALIVVSIMTNETPEYTEAELAFVTCQRLAVREVRDPASAEWEPTNNKAGVAIGNEQYRVTTWVRAKNARGAIVRHNVVCVIDGTGNQLQLVSLDFGEAQ